MWATGTVPAMVGNFHFLLEISTANHRAAFFQGPLIAQTRKNEEASLAACCFYFLPLHVTTKSLVCWGYLSTSDVRRSAGGPRLSSEIGWFMLLGIPKRNFFYELDR